jgi:hypothetical protein
VLSIAHVIEKKTGEKNLTALAGLISFGWQGSDAVNGQWMNQLLIITSSACMYIFTISLYLDVIFWQCRERKNP